MGLWDKLKQASKWRGQDSYSRYKGKREYERKRADRDREEAEAGAKLGREKAERERGYDERYTRERESNTGSD